MSDFALPQRGDIKGENGKVLVIGGCPDIHGAPILAALGALAAGADVVSLFLPETHVPAARSKELNLFISGFRHPHFETADAKEIAAIATDWADSVVIGCGFLEDEISAVTTFLKRYHGPAVLDAGALFPETLKIIKGRDNILLTPHAGEFERLFAASGSPAEVEAAAQKYGVTILRKGVVDVIASPNLSAENTTGNALMTVGGTGDALAGICGGLLARGLSPFEAGVLAAGRWGKTGDMLAKDYEVLSAVLMLNSFRRR